MNSALVNCRLAVVFCLFFSLFSSQLSATPYVYAKAQQLTISNAQQAARVVKGRYGGKVLKVQRTKINGKPGYKVKILKSNGHVVSVKVDAKSGKVSG